MTDGGRLEALRDALARDPANHALRLLLADSLLDAGRRHEAADEFERLVEAGALDQADLVRAGVTAVDCGRLQLAARCLERARQAGVLDGVSELAERLTAQLSRVDDDPVEPQLPALAGEAEQTTFADVGGLDDVKRRIERSIILPFQRADLYSRYGRTAGAGVMLYGPPGCGKTLLARATAGECRLPFINVRIEEILSAYIGESERALHSAFEAARVSAPCVVFLDELDALAYARRKQAGGTGRALVDQLLQELDSIGSDNTNLLILGATNAPWDVDDALKRPGRLEKLQFVPPPDRAARARIFEIFLASKPTDRIDPLGLAAKTALFSGADISAVVNAAIDAAIEEALETGRELPITSSGLEKAISEIRPTTLEWLRTARNYVEFANDAGRYDEVEEFLRSREAKAWGKQT